MANTFIPSEQEFAELKQEITEIKRILLVNQKPTQELFDNAELMRYLKVSRRTLATWRAEQLIEFSQIGSKLYYSKDQVAKFLERYKNKRLGK